MFMISNTVDPQCLLFDSIACRLFFQIFVTYSVPWTSIHPHHNSHVRTYAWWRCLVSSCSPGIREGSVRDDWSGSESDPRPQDEPPETQRYRYSGTISARVVHVREDEWTAEIYQKLGIWAKYLLPYILDEIFTRIVRTMFECTNFIMDRHMFYTCTTFERLNLIYKTFPHWANKAKTRAAWY